jgi:hypothetical protein
MKLRFPVAAALALALFVVSNAAAVTTNRFVRPVPQGPAAQILRNCATPEPTALELDQVGSALSLFLGENAVAATGNIKVAFHVIYNPTTGEGNIPQTQIDAQIAKLNSDYAGTGFTFSLASVDRTGNRKWFSMTPGTGNETNAKNTLAISPATRFNVYTAKPGQSLLGWATFPWSYAETSKNHGVVMHYASVPGGSLAPYNLGRTLVHEAGHYLGLYHTFQGGCVAPGDQVDDTPFEASAAFGCPTGRNTCSQAGNDPITNFMDYTDDACMIVFSGGQTTRMQTAVGQYKPSLLNAAAIVTMANAPATEEARVTGGLLFRNAFPNPFTRGTALRFATPRAGNVTVKVYNVAGQLVSTLQDGVLEAGEHTLEFAPQRLAPGTYFVHLQAGAESARRTIIFVR